MGRQPKLVEVKKRRKEQERKMKMKWWKRMQPNLTVRGMRG